MINQVSEDFDPDGFSVNHIDDGWVKYKGMSWGFAMQRDPDVLVMTWGPDGPFVGQRRVLVPLSTDKHGEIKWLDKSTHEPVFFSLTDLATYGLATLASLVGDTVPLICS